MQYAQTKSDVKTSVPDAVKKAEQKEKDAKTKGKKKNNLAQISDSSML